MWYYRAMRRLLKKAKVWYRLYSRAAFVVILVVVATATLFFALRDKTLEEIQKEQLQVAQIIQSGDIAGCSAVKGLTLNDTDYYAVCRGNILLQKAKATLDASLCDGLDNALFAVEECKAGIRIMRIERGMADLAVCQESKSQDDRDLCLRSYWFKQAIKKDDISLCDSIEKNGHKEQCRASVLMSNLISGKNVKCASFTENALRLDCGEFQKAFSTRDLSLCAEIGDLGLRAACQDSLAPKDEL